MYVLWNWASVYQHAGISEVLTLMSQPDRAQHNHVDEYFSRGLVAVTLTDLLLHVVDIFERHLLVHLFQSSSLQGQRGKITARFAHFVFREMTR